MSKYEDVAREHARLKEEVDLYRKKLDAARAERSRLLYERYWTDNNIKKPKPKPGRWVKKWRKRARDRREWSSRRKTNIGMVNATSRQFGRGVYSSFPGIPDRQMFLCQGSIQCTEEVNSSEE